MPGTLAALAQTFQDCVMAFNAYDKTIGGNLAPDISIHSVHKNEVYSGTSSVEGYLESQFSDNPQFDPAGNQQVGVDATGTYGMVSSMPGKPGRWRDDNNTHKQWEPIRYTFVFWWSGSQWLLLSGVALP